MPAMLMGGGWAGAVRSDVGRGWKANFTVGVEGLRRKSLAGSHNRVSVSLRLTSCTSMVKVSQLMTQCRYTVIN